MRSAAVDCGARFLRRKDSGLVELIAHLAEVARVLADHDGTACHRSLGKVVAAAALEQAVADECDLAYAVGGTRGGALQGLRRWRQHHCKG